MIGKRSNSHSEEGGGDRVYVSIGGRKCTVNYLTKTKLVMKIIYVMVERATNDNPIVPTGETIELVEV